LTEGTLRPPGIGIKATVYVSFSVLLSRYCFNCVCSWLPLKRNKDLVYSVADPELGNKGLKNKGGVWEIVLNFKQK